ncbi:TPA: glycosyltransferase family 2 protein [Klebsiella aerogenes]|nr:glycosyltransferase family 2 protein [Klebsiella aerogenes]EMA4692801.1 glycosyltransferase family 2 protein [Klebsiella aerogenes]KLF28529.1 glycosyl transferase [Klebsiella aerogenes]KZQ66714.1 glycosyl transferase [Klebsiella aerogenes]WVJ32307.1 glycosyltransferase family 2 protein [Klebsiella aerogenes]
MSYKAMKPKVIASIVLFNHSYDDIKDTLFSLSHEESVERVILVDNGGCQWAASLNEPKISYIKSPYNSGFGAGHNLAINANIGFDGYFLICNPDISFNKQSLDKLVSFAWENEYDFVSPQIIYKNGERQYSCRLLPTPGNLFLRRFLPATAIKYDATYELKDAEYDKVFSPPSVSGCFMLLTNSLLQKLNGFDERYFMYLEDVDLCRRALQYTKIYYCPKTTIIHVFNKGSYKSKLLLWYHIRSAIAYFNKWGWFFDKKRHAYNESALRNIPRKLN